MKCNCKTTQKIEAKVVNQVINKHSNPMSNAMDYSKMTITELTALCREKGIKRYSGKKKADIIAILMPDNTVEVVAETEEKVEVAETEEKAEVVAEKAAQVKVKQVKAVREAGLDKFYTIPSVSEKCLSSIGSRYKWSDWGLVIEPSAGNGSFLTQIPTTKKLGIDISPDHADIIKQDFLTYSPSEKKILVVGNPPFGRVSSLAIKFFNHASTWADVIAFIIPRTFRRVSVHNKLNPSFHLVLDEEIPMEPCSFSPPMKVKCCFQIWEKRDTQRPIVKLSTIHEDWDFLGLGPKDAKGQPTPPDGADFAIRAYGGKCGEIIDTGLEKLRPKSWHWIKAKIDKNTLMDRFTSLDYTLSLDTARQNSIGMGELVGIYSDAYD